LLFLASCLVLPGVIQPLPAQPLVEEQKAIIEVPLTSGEIRWIKSSGLTGYETAQAAIAVPKDFNPEQPYPILVTCVTGEPGVSNIREMDKYWPQAVQEGWVVVTGWAEPNPEMDTKAFRRALTVASMRKLHELVPQSRDWPVAVAGFSGGSKNTAVIAAYLQMEGYRIIGLFMGGCNKDMATWALKKLSPDRPAYLRIPIFLSTGDADRVSTVQQSQAVAKSMAKSGFVHIRQETYAGAHRLNRDHVPVALQWFRELDSQMAR